VIVVLTNISTGAKARLQFFPHTLTLENYGKVIGKVIGKY
jgi:hypothetical protein